MEGLPSGTVTLLFSDIEGSTQLLSRLGQAYADALDAQRQVLRTAWAQHDGTELGTEGDSFFVAFPTAAAAVSGAAEGQRRLAQYPWPGGAPVRVRMGIHTGSPVSHDGGYVGMDVHRAARIAAAAHGGQVVVSAATAELIVDSFEGGVGLRDLGRHRLKDIPRSEHLYQLVIEGLDPDFPPLKSLGAATTLPTLATSLVGRDGELRELDELLGDGSDMRLATLTGPGGSGKTRLAIELARRMAPLFPDGTYFVPLAAVTSPAVMWTTIAEVVSLPAEERTPTALIAKLAHSRALLVLDNLEQLPGADAVVADLLAHAHRLVVVATSRRPLHVAGENEYAVPPLQLPDDDVVDTVSRSDAVQLFVQQARRVRSAFELTADNASDVAAICRRLDGLPLALELAASRAKLLSPKAMLTRLDKALDIVATDHQRPTRQRTMRSAIAWSYELLTPHQQTLFRRLGVFSGGADLEAIAAIAAPAAGIDDAELLELVTDLVDASLVAVSEADDAEPRIAMLETVRTYALGQLADSGELSRIQQTHALHYLRVAEDLGPLLHGSRHLEAMNRLDVEFDNLREALAWALEEGEIDNHTERVQVALGLCAAIGRYWRNSGLISEGRHWLERTVSLAAGRDQPLLARCLTDLANHVRILGEDEHAYQLATASVEMWRRLAVKDPGVPYALSTLAGTAGERQPPDAIRALYEEALALARESGEAEQLHRALTHLSRYEVVYEHNIQRAFELDTEALAVAHERGDAVAVRLYRQFLASYLRLLGRVEEAHEQMRSLVASSLAIASPVDLTTFAGDYAAVLAQLGDHRQAVRMFGAADAMRERYGWTQDEEQEALHSEPIAITRAALSPAAWHQAYNEGRGASVEDTIRQAYAESS